MLFTKVSIHTIAHLEAPHVLTSAQISTRLAKTLKRVKLSETLLERMTGIKERRFWSGNIQPSDVATEVAEKVIQKSGLQKSDIDAVISTSITKDFLEPSIASIVHGNLKLPAKCINFDVGSACLGFLNGIQVAASMIEAGMLKHVLIVSGESGHQGMEATLARLEQTNANAEDVRNQLATLTLGSGGVAMIVSHKDSAPAGHPIKSALFLAASEHARLCCGWHDRMETDAPELLKQALEIKVKTVELAKNTQGWDLATFDEIVFHQVSKSYINEAIKRLKIDSKKVYLTYPTFGNMASASLPYTLSKLSETGRLVPGKKVALIGAGSGLNAMVFELVW
ncbi:MAG TPA: 3-oxoacyl-ACP synthase III [Burkholderiaceae bacterium]|nr:3-oxoacyl-ACP synthase III [Burkholderiaceae bacterium]